MEGTHQKVDLYLLEGCGRCPLGGTFECKVHNWLKELTLLRKVILECGFTEELKWKIPCYTINGKNIVTLAAFKEYCALSFFKGSLIKDTFSILQKPGENTQFARLIKFTDIEQILDLEIQLKAYLLEAITIEEKGLSVEFKEKHELILPDELLEVFIDNPKLKASFEALTPGKQRGYNIYFTAPKQSKTRTTRIEKYISKILSGKGFYD